MFLESEIMYRSADISQFLQRRLCAVCVSLSLFNITNDEGEGSTLANSGPESPNTCTAENYTMQKEDQYEEINTTFNHSKINQATPFEEIK